MDTYASKKGFVNTILPKLGLSHLFGMKKLPLWLSYNREGDALHVVFEEADKKDKTVLDKDDIIVTKRNGKVINMTILHASRFAQ